MMMLLLACVSDPSPAAATAVTGEPNLPAADAAAAPQPSAVASAELEPAAPVIVDKPIPFPEERKALTQAYLAQHWGAEHLTGELEADITMEPRVIVLHWTAGPTAQGAWSTFSPSRLPGRPELQRAGALNVSAHFVVARDGTIWRLLPEDRVARHVIGMNHLAIGIENVGGIDGYPLTQAQVEANVELVRYLKAAWPGITHLIGHHEYQEMEGHPYFQEVDPTYRTVKPDPGEDFMSQVRALVIDLGLEGTPT